MIEIIKRNIRKTHPKINPFETILLNCKEICSLKKKLKFLICYTMPTHPPYKIGHRKKHNRNDDGPVGKIFI